MQNEDTAMQRLGMGIALQLPVVPVFSMGLHKMLLEHGYREQACPGHQDQSTSSEVRRGLGLV